MKKFTVKFLREFEVEIETDDEANAYVVANDIVKQFPKHSVRLLSVIQEGHEDNACVGCLYEQENDQGPHGPKGGPPNLGGSPATPVVKLPDLADQVAEAA